MNSRYMIRGIGLVLAALLFGCWPLLAFGATCAHNETGFALDPAPCADIQQYIARFNSAVTANWTAVTVPDGTQHGAKATCSNGNCTYQNPTPPSVPSIPAVMTKFQFQQYSYVQLGAIAEPAGTSSEQMISGITRFGQILLAMKASSDPGTAAAYDGYNNNINFDLSYVTVFISLVGPTGSQIITQPEASAFIGNWPHT